MLRTVGMTSQVDAFEETLNRAAERATGKALPIFGDLAYSAGRTTQR